MTDLDGKQRRAARLRDASGWISILAIDHTESLRAAFAGTPADDVLVATKLEIVRQLGSDVSGILLDPLLGAAPALEAGAIPPTAGLILSIEALDYANPYAAPELLPDWGPAQALVAGADAAKLLVYYRPDASDAQTREAFVADVAASCREVQLPLLVEPLPYPLPTDSGRAPDLTLLTESVRRMRSLGADLLKLPFPPGPMPEAKQRCRALTEAAGDVPWVLLSQGVGLDDYIEQLAIAVQAGAAGFAAGRSIWGDLIDSSTELAGSIGRDRLRACLAVLRDIVPD